MAHRWLGFIHAMYGMGLLVSPFVATGVAVRGKDGGDRWMLFYLFPLGLGACNLVGCGVAFRDSLGWKLRKEGRERQRDGEGGGDGVVVGGNSGEREARRTSMGELREMMKLRDLWVLCLFYFFYLGAAMTAGGSSLFPLPSLPPLHFPTHPPPRLDHRIPHPRPARPPLPRRLRALRFLRRHRPRPSPPRRTHASIRRTQNAVMLFVYVLRVAVGVLVGAEFDLEYCYV